MSTQQRKDKDMTPIGYFNSEALEQLYKDYPYYEAQAVYEEEHGMCGVLRKIVHFGWRERNDGPDGLGAFAVVYTDDLGPNRMRFDTMREAVEWANLEVELGSTDVDVVLR